MKHEPCVRRVFTAKLEHVNKVCLCDSLGETESGSGFVGWCDRKSAAWNWWKIHFLYETEKEKEGRRYSWLWETKWGRSTCGFSFLLIFKLSNNRNEGLWCDGDAYLYVLKLWSTRSWEIQKKLWKPPRLKTLKKHPPACEHCARSFPMNSPLRTTSWACCSRVFFLILLPVR